MVTESQSLDFRNRLWLVSYSGIIFMVMSWEWNLGLFSDKIQNDIFLRNVFGPEKDLCFCNIFYDKVA